jgi:hypothetical protein
MEKRREGYRESAGEGFFWHFIPYITFFFAIGDGIEEKLLKLF